MFLFCNTFYYYSRSSPWHNAWLKIMTPSMLLEAHESRGLRGPEQGSLGYPIKGPSLSSPSWAHTNTASAPSQCRVRGSGWAWEMGVGWEIARQPLDCHLPLAQVDMGPTAGHCPLCCIVPSFRGLAGRRQIWGFLGPLPKHSLSLCSAFSLSTLSPQTPTCHSIQFCHRW